jgi:response regulator RpfG family c-di-GMP phosphodiesterase
MRRLDMTAGGAVRSAGRVPDSWLVQVDERSHAGRGHGRRVGRIAQLLAEHAVGPLANVDPDDLMLAGLAHELGRLSYDVTQPVMVAEHGAALLREVGCAAVVVEGVRHLNEHWDGTGGPEALAGQAIPVVSQVLLVADTLDHYVSALLRTGLHVAEALERALGLMWIQQGTVFNPALVESARRQRSRLPCVWSEPRLVVVPPEPVVPAAA